MASIAGTAAIMAQSRTTWHGTLMLIGQPAEETIGGADGMIKDGLLTRFPRPDVAVALHVGNELPAGFAILRVPSMDEAIEWVKRCPNPMEGDSEIEIRPLRRAAA